MARLLLVAGAGPLAEGLLVFFRTVPGVEVIGRVDEFPSSPKEISELAPSVVVLDLGPSVEDGLATVTKIGAALPAARCVVLADEVEQQCAAENLGADAALLKGCRPAELRAAIRAAATPDWRTARHAG